MKVGPARPTRTPRWTGVDDNARVVSDRGHLKVFIGMAPGVGKTYRMLQEGVAEADSGRDVVVGYLESHGRAETVAQAEGLEIVPRRSVVYRGTPLQEMDLPAVLARKPELCLIDELAHTNAPGVEHEKRYEDVRDVLEAGIDVFSTVNVQHLESLNDQITQLTGSITRETIPDEVLSMADEVVLIDLTPEALIARLKAGKVYRPERVQAALNNFFKIENLAALRETALRQVAEDVEVKRLVRAPAPIGPSRAARATRKGCAAKPRGGAAGDRRAAAGAGDARAALRAGRAPRVALGPALGRRARRARRAALRACAQRGRPQAAGGAAAAVRDARRAAARRGGRRRRRGGDPPGALAGQHLRAARRRPRRRKGLRRFGASASDRALPMRLLRGLPGVDIRIIADPALRGEAGEAEPASGGERVRSSSLSAPGTPPPGELTPMRPPARRSRGRSGPTRCTPTRPAAPADRRPPRSGRASSAGSGRPSAGSG